MDKRASADGDQYTKAEFLDFYGATHGPEQWLFADSRRIKGVKAWEKHCPEYAGREGFPDWPLDINNAFYHGTALHEFAQYNNIEAVRDFLDAGADPNAHDGNAHGGTPLHLAIMENNAEIAALLIEGNAEEGSRKADPNLLTDDEWAYGPGNQSALDLALAESPKCAQMLKSKLATHDENALYVYGWDHLDYHDDEGNLWIGSGLFIDNAGNLCEYQEEEGRVNLAGALDNDIARIAEEIRD